MRHGCVHYLRRCCINGQQQHARYWLRAGGVDKDRRLCFRQSRSLLTWAVQLDAQAQNLDGEYAQAAPKPAFKAAIDFRAIRDNFDQVVQNVRNRNSAANPKKVLQLYDEWRELEDETGRVRSERNDNAKSMKGKLDPERRAELIEQGKYLKDTLAEMESRLSSIQDALQLEGQRLPNSTHPEVPRGGEEAVRTLRTIGEVPEHKFQTRDHLELGAALDLIDFEAGASVAGAKFVYLKRAAALLELALCNWAMAKAAAKGFIPVSTPDLVRAGVLEKCGFQPRGENTQVYSIENSPLCLTGTAEVPLGGMYMDQIIMQEQLPIKLAGFGHCFRTEAGAAGSASKGLYRVHQFSKVELFVLSTPEQSEALLQDLCDLEEEMFAQLGLHFKIQDMPTGDLGAPAYRKLDVEAWMPGLQRYGEISSASNCTDYQSRRLNIRFRPRGTEDGKGKGKGAKVSTEFVHTLNATACAVPRMIVAILENFQQADGSVNIPAPLIPFMGGLEAIKPPPHHA